VEHAVPEALVSFEVLGAFRMKPAIDPVQLAVRVDRQHRVRRRDRLAARGMPIRPRAPRALLLVRQEVRRHLCEISPTEPPEEEIEHFLHVLGVFLGLVAEKPVDFQPP
jgi:hypothetical protein